MTGTLRENPCNFVIILLNSSQNEKYFGQKL
jgi:hypothetical protein